MSDALTVRVKNHLGELERVGGAIEAFGAAHRLPARAVFDLTLAVDEVLTNIIAYAFDDGGEHEIVVRVSMDDPARRVVTVEVEDDGHPFDPLQVAPPQLDRPLDERAIGGLGMHLVRKVTDSLAYRREQGKNRLVMRKRIATQQ
jgi:anti-sigma regulatory factor (Ser/Thr protein kinase)